MPTLQEIRCKLLSLYGMANAFRLIDDHAVMSIEEMAGQLKAAKETGKLIADGLLSIVWQIPKLPAPPAVRTMDTKEFEVLTNVIGEWKLLVASMVSTCDLNDADAIVYRMERIYAAAAANIWV